MSWGLLARRDAGRTGEAMVLGDGRWSSRRVVGLLDVSGAVRFALEAVELACVGRLVAGGSAVETWTDRDAGRWPTRRTIKVAGQRKHPSVRRPAVLWTTAGQGQATPRHLHHNEDRVDLQGDVQGVRVWMVAVRGGLLQTNRMAVPQAHRGCGVATSGWMEPTGRSSEPYGHRVARRAAGTDG